MRVDLLTVGMFASNSYVVSCEKTHEAIIIDAGDEGDSIVDHVKTKKLDVKLTKAEMNKRLKSWRPPKRKISSGYLARYARLVTSGSTGAVFED